MSMCDCVCASVSFLLQADTYDYCAVSLAGHTLGLASSKYILLVDVRTNTEICKLELDVSRNTPALCLRPQMNLLAVSFSSTVAMFDLRRREQIEETPVSQTGEVNDLWFDATRMLVGCDDHNLVTMSSLPDAPGKAELRTRRRSSGSDSDSSVPDLLL